MTNETRTIRIANCLRHEMTGTGCEISAAAQALANRHQLPAEVLLPEEKDGTVWEDTSYGDFGVFWPH